MTEAGVERRLTTILVADVVGYSRLMGMDEARRYSALSRHRKDLINPQAAQYGEEITSSAGGGGVDLAVNVANNCEDEGRAPAEQDHTVDGFEAAEQPPFFG